MTASTALAGPSTVAVGPATCQPSTPHYPTIQAAINAVNNGGTVNVCPGTYGEQLLITKPVTVKGIVDGGSSLVTLVVPGTGLVANAVMPVSGIVAAQIAVVNTKDVTITNLTVDGSGGACPTSIGADRGAGIAFSNVGSSWSYDGRVTQSVVKQQQYAGCGLSDGILSENSYLTVDTNNIREIGVSGISQIGGASKVTNNVIDTCFGGPGVYLRNVSLASSITLNAMFNTAYGVRLDGTSNSTTSLNNIGPYASVGVYVTGGSTNNLVALNRLVASWAAIYLTGAKNTTVYQNYVIRSGMYGVQDSASAGGNKIWSNTINDAPFGIYHDVPSSTTDSFSGNSFLGVKTLTTTTGS